MVGTHTYIIRQEANAVFVSEYSRVSEIARGRARFFSGQKPILVYRWVVMGWWLLSILLAVVLLH